MLEVPPRYPGISRSANHQGTTGVYAVIEKDGSVNNLAVVETAGADLDKAALEAVRQWKFEPSTCNGEPVAIETEIFVHFAMQ